VRLLSAIVNLIPKLFAISAAANPQKQSNVRKRFDPRLSPRFLGDQTLAMTSTNLSPSSSRREAVLACSIIFFFLAMLCILLGWADGVRHGHAYLRFPTTGGWVIGAAVMAVLGILFLLWSRATKRS